jgi:hypothetical protein
MAATVSHILAAVCESPIAAAGGWPTDGEATLAARLWKAPKAPAGRRVADYGSLRDAVGGGPGPPGAWPGIPGTGRRRRREDHASRDRGAPERARMRGRGPRFAPSPQESDARPPTARPAESLLARTKRSARAARRRGHTQVHRDAAVERLPNQWRPVVRRHSGPNFALVHMRRCVARP